MGLVSIFVPMTMALYRKKLSSEAAMASILVGLGSWLLFHWLIPLPINALIPGLFASWLAFELTQWWVNRRATSRQQPSS
jgi:Na+/pantothenate symporter